MFTTEEKSGKHLTWQKATGKWDTGAGREFATVHITSTAFPCQKHNIVLLSCRNSY
jgi:hypothetical protein